MSEERIILANDSIGYLAEVFYCELYDAEKDTDKSGKTLARAWASYDAMEFKTIADKYKEYFEPHAKAFALMNEVAANYNNPTIEDIYYELNKIIREEIEK